jgi:predicted restriction endonuclease
MERRNWTKDELILAFALYIKLPFGKMHRNTVEVIELAGVIDRTPSAVAMRLVNFASIDPYHQARGVFGLQGGIKQCQPIWDEFINNKEELIYKSELLLANKQNIKIENKYSYLLQDTKELKGLTKERVIKTRVNQSVFRQVILSMYSNKCAISGINIPELLVASHIIPWSENVRERLNPSNGICFSSLYDKAFDKGFIGIKKDYTMILSRKIRNMSTETYFARFFNFVDGKKILLPERYLPSVEFLEYHIDTIFKR